MFSLCNQRIIQLADASKCHLINSFILQVAERSVCVLQPHWVMSPSHISWALTISVHTHLTALNCKHQALVCALFLMFGAHMTYAGELTYLLQQWRQHLTKNWWELVDKYPSSLSLCWDKSEVCSTLSCRGPSRIEPQLPTVTTCSVTTLYRFPSFPCNTSLFSH